METIENALEAWLNALNARGVPNLLRKAASDDVTVERFGFGAHRGELRERITGIEAVSKWMALTPKGTVFSLTTSATPLGEQWQVEYKLEIQDFVGGGKWLLELDPNGLVAILAHHPNELEDGADEWEGDWAQWRKDNLAKK